MMFKFKASTVLEISTILALSVVQINLAEAKGTRDGGGEPYANQFLQIAQLIHQAQSEAHIDLGVTNERLKAEITKIERSLEGKKPQLVFPTGETVNCFGAPKLGCTKNGVVSIARKGWRSATESEKIEVVTMELSLRSGGTNRYKIGELVAKVLDLKSNSSPARLLLGENSEKLDFEMMFDPCRLQSLNAVLKKVSKNSSLLQYDLSSKDGYESQISSIETLDEAGMEEAGLVREVHYLSSLSNDGRRSTLKLHAISSKYRVDENGYCKLSEALSTIDEQQTRENRGHSGAQTALFDPCARAVLNHGLNIIGLDSALIKTKPANPGLNNFGIELYSAFQALRSESNLKTYVLNFVVSQSAFSIVYTVKVDGRTNGRSCQIQESKGS